VVHPVAEVIHIDQLSFSYGDKQVLQGINLSAEEGETLVILGPSGSGKSTILKLLAGLLEPGTGEVEITTQTSGVGTRLVFQTPRLFPWLSVRKNLYFALRSAQVPRTEWDSRIAPLMEQVGLLGELDAAVPELSFGMAQRVSLVRALVCQPSVLLLDEPFSALDPRRRRQLQQDLLKLVSFTGVSVVMVTHDIQEAIDIGDQIVVLSGQPAQITAELRTKDAEIEAVRAQLTKALLL